MPGRATTVASPWLVLAALLVSAGPARAQTPEMLAEDQASPALELDWSGPADCDRGDAVRAKVVRLLGGNLRALTQSLKVSVTVRHEQAKRYIAELATVTSTGRGTKRLEGESCDAIALASSVVIALSIDPNASLDAEQPVLEAPPSRPALQRLEPAPPKPRAREKRQTSAYLHGSVGVLFALLQEPSAFTAAGVGARHRRYSLELGGAVYQPRDVFLVNRPRLGAELRLFTGELLACYAAVPFALGAIEVCPGARLEYVMASSFGVSHPDRAQVLVLAGAWLLRGRLRATSWLSAALDAGVAARAFQPTFVVQGVGDVFEIPVVSPFARTGLAVEF